MAARRCGRISGITISPVCTCTSLSLSSLLTFLYFGSTEGGRLFLQSVGNFYCLVFLRFGFFDFFLFGKW